MSCFLCMRYATCSASESRTRKAITPGLSITLWTVRIACVFYAFALAAWLMRNARAARALWTAGLLAYLAHVAAAFHYLHHWSHPAAYQETARQTAALFKIDWGGGLYFNYAFTVVWTADVVWMWWNAEGYRTRGRRMSAAVHAFMAFMFLNATVVFASGWTRWLSLGGFLALAFLAGVLRRRAKNGSKPHAPVFC